MFKSFNSKRFLLLYLVVFASLLLAWVFGLKHSEPDRRDIPPDLKPILLSPPAEVSQFLLYSANRHVLTDQSLRGKWSFIYFTHPACLPACAPVLTVMQNLKQHVASQEVQYLLINIDEGKDAERSLPFVEVAGDLPLYFADPEILQQLTDDFAFLSLRTAFERGYGIEQQHSIFLTDPKGRVYARFEPPFTSAVILENFFKLRNFYARSE